jgi:predicted NAD/FAD-dependent oxidoreductase
MRKRLTVAGLIALVASGCSDGTASVSDVDAPTQPAASAVAVTAPAPLTAQPAAPVEIAALSNADQGRACRAAIASVMGREPSIIRIVSRADDVVRVGYTRDDGTKWQNECRVTGNKVEWRTYENGRSGRWRTEDSITVTLKGGDVVHVRQTSYGELLDDADYTVR